MKKLYPLPSTSAMRLLQEEKDFLRMNVKFNKYGTLEIEMDNIDEARA